MEPSPSSFGVPLRELDPDIDQHELAVEVPLRYGRSFLYHPEHVP